MAINIPLRGMLISAFLRQRWNLSDMFVCRYRVIRNLLMITIMACGMLFSSVNAVASHGTNGFTVNPSGFHETEATVLLSDDFHHHDMFQRSHGGHNAADHFHETPERPPVIEIEVPHVADSWIMLPDTRTPRRPAEFRYRPPTLVFL